MAFDPENPYTIAGKNVQGGLPTANQQLQFNATTNQWEFVTAVAAGLGDLEFLRDKELAGDLLSDSGITSSAGVTIASITPASGKTLFLVSATGSSGAGSSQRILRVDGVTIEEPLTDLAGGTTNFGALVLSLVGDGVKIMDVFNISAVQGVGFIEGWIQNT